MVWQVLSETLQKGCLDTCEYKHLKLEQNELRVLLVSNKESKQACTALDVHVGYNHEPEKWPGLAHFCEHLLFMVMPTVTYTVVVVLETTL
jgi:insulysin